MTREDRIREARRKAAERAPIREAEDRERAKRVHRRVSSIGASEAQRSVSEAARSGKHGYIGPLKTPKAWATAVDVAREVAIEAAKSQKTITYGEIRLAVFEETGWLVGHSMFAELVVSVNHHGDGVLLSSIIVHQDDGRPGDGFLPYAREMGFEGSVEMMQREVWRWATRSKDAIELTPPT